MTVPDWRALWRVLGPCLGSKMVQGKHSCQGLWEPPVLPVPPVTQGEPWERHFTVWDLMVPIVKQIWACLCSRPSSSISLQFNIVCIVWSWWVSRLGKDEALLCITKLEHYCIRSFFIKKMGQVEVFFLLGRKTVHDTKLTIPNTWLQIWTTYLLMNSAMEKTGRHQARW